jgi:hypothetical protein
MARWATTCVLGGVSFSGCRVELIDAGQFKSQNAGSVDYANDGSPHVQTVNRGRKGIPFGLKMVSAQQSQLTDLFTAIETAEGTQSTIEAQIVDGMFNLAIDITPDYSQNWFSWEKHSEGYYENVALRFISHGDS